MSPLTGIAVTMRFELDEEAAAYVASPPYCAEIGCRPVSQKVTSQLAESLVSICARQVAIGLPRSEKVTVPVGVGAPGVVAGVETVADIVVRCPWRTSLATRRATAVWVAPAAAGALCGVAAKAMAAPTTPARSVARKKRTARLRGEVVARALPVRRRNPAKPRVLEPSDRFMTVRDVRL